jgi:DNA-binding LacI/PurR family transcriptional regulator
MKMARGAVMADVARQAGVSVMTVSRVLNGFPGVAGETRLRVENAVQALDYRANAAARILAGGRSHTLGVIAVETEQFGPSHMLFGIEAAARAADLALTFVTLRSVDRNELRSTLDHLRGMRVEGVILIAPVRQVVDAVRRLDVDLPLVLVGGDPSTHASTVTIDQHGGARLATEHLLDLGHATVHHISGPRAWIDASERIRGWEDALRARGARRGGLYEGDWSARSGYAIGASLARDRSVTAIFAANDQTALGVLRALHDQKRSVPEHVSVIGFDNTPEAGFYVPPLTTIGQNFAEVGERSVQLLLSRLDDDSSDPLRITVAPELIVRDSSAPPPAPRQD